MAVAYFSPRKYGEVMEIIVIELKEYDGFLSTSVITGRGNQKM